jgi:hypothetical protein
MTAGLFNLPPLPLLRCLPPPRIVSLLILLTSHSHRPCPPHSYRPRTTTHQCSLIAVRPPLSNDGLLSPTPQSYLTRFAPWAPPAFSPAPLQPPKSCQSWFFLESVLRGLLIFYWLNISLSSIDEPELSDRHSTDSTSSSTFRSPTLSCPIGIQRTAVRLQLSVLQPPVILLLDASTIKPVSYLHHAKPSIARSPLRSGPTVLSRHLGRRHHPVPASAVSPPTTAGLACQTPSPFFSPTATNPWPSPDNTIKPNPPLPLLARRDWGVKRKNYILQQVCTHG